MSDSSRKAIRSYLEALDSHGDIADHLTDDVGLEMAGSPGADAVRGREAVAEFIRSFHRVAFDARVAVRQVVAEDDRAIAELVFEGVHTGEFAGVAAAGAHVSLPYCVAYDLRDDLISGLRVYLSVPDLVAQLRS